MKSIVIEWKHFDKDGSTCKRCNDTGISLKQAISDLQSTFQKKGVEIHIIETKLTKRDMDVSNSLLINGEAIEDVIEGISVVKNECNSCSDLAESPCCCRAIQSKHGVHDEIPKETIINAIIKFL